MITMVYVVYLQDGPEPMGVRTNNRVVTSKEQVTEMSVPCEGGVGLWRYAHEHITIGTGQAAVFEFVHMVQQHAAPPPPHSPK
ncbi:MAG: hypothetical protein HOV83_12590 [Catenulispora sp.]|nr:hypothetical protein [Catenulispora sp.]